MQGKPHRRSVEIAHLRHLTREDDGVVDTSDGQLRIHLATCAFSPFRQGPSSALSTGHRPSVFVGDANGEVVPVNVQGNFQIVWVKMWFGRIVEVGNPWSCKDDLANGRWIARAALHQV